MHVYTYTNKCVYVQAHVYILNVVELDWMSLQQEVMPDTVNIVNIPWLERGQDPEGEASITNFLEQHNF